MEPIAMVGLGVVLFALINSCSSSNTRRRRQKQSIEKDLEDLAENLSPSEKYIQAGQQAANSVFTLLQENADMLGLSIARTKIAGSVGKNTGISFIDMQKEQLVNPDFDCVLFVNDEEPPFRYLMRDIGNLLEKHPCIRNVTTKSRFSIQFYYFSDSKDEQYSYAIPFDLLPATNYVKGLDLVSLRGQSVGELEARIVQKNIREQQKRSIAAENDVNEQKNRMYSSCLAEMTVDCIRDYVKVDRTLKVVRLAKFWNYHLDMDGEYVSARSCIIEIIAIHAHLKRVKKRDLVASFYEFLEAMRDFSKLEISLNNQSINPVFDNELPLIIDPANELNNLARGISKRAVNVFETQAKMTLNYLNELRKTGVYEGCEDDVERIFLHKQGDTYPIYK
ncbi:hypothetical protein Ocin01_02208 [Orchesella cincta]|uniref:Nucleotidyltransferase n=1 Tax=Orchesella cincta TaxID=48709 RepID=A0A1D2NHB2_ORCCI|nr:hypothetical protein Ocin01_02208 [Orchesella cincta]